MMYYLTFNDPPSGVYFGQVIDVCDYISKEFRQPVKLIALISIRNFFHNRRLIKQHYHNSIVLPMFPKHENWKMNVFTLYILMLLRRRSSFIARGPFAAGMLFSLKRKGLVKGICFDGRGAYSGELSEYDVVREQKLKEEIFAVEKQAVMECDFRIAVSNQLVNYWKEWFGYNDNCHAVVPCTFNSGYIFKLPSPIEIASQRKKLGFDNGDIVLVYSGSVAGWQSLELVDRFLLKCMKDEAIKVLFLANVNLDELQAYKVFPGRISKQWVKPGEVNAILCSCDYGILVRERTVTNKVASPTKFAEYLVAGLPVIISEELGDYTGFVKENKCGFVINDELSITKLPVVTYEEKKRLSALAIRYFSKSQYKQEYAAVIAGIS